MSWSTSMGPRTNDRSARRLHRLLPLLLVFALLSGCHGTLFAALNSTDQRQGIAAERDIVFDARHGLSLDVYRPREARNAPVVVFFYGGDWTHGKRQWYRFVGSALAARGMVVIIPDYRKYPAVRMDGFMQDAARAVAWAHDYAGVHGGNPQQLFVMGHSAGGQIAALLATDRHWLHDAGLPNDVLAGCIGLAGVYDFAPLPAKEHDMRVIFGQTPVEQARGEPVTHVGGGEPPMLLLHGTADREVAPANSQSLARVLQDHGDTVTMRMYPGIGHSPLLLALARPLRGHADTLADIVGFVGASLSRRQR
jgi:acetyl esterase/lipase